MLTQPCPRYVRGGGGGLVPKKPDSGLPAPLPNTSQQGRALCGVGSMLERVETGLEAAEIETGDGTLEPSVGPSLPGLRAVALRGRAARRAQLQVVRLHVVCARDAGRGRRERA